MQKLQSSVLVIGGGIAGIQASLDLTKLGFKVYLVEIKPTIGGTMAQLDKTFPTLDCSLCILAPKMVEIYRNQNIELFTNSYIEKIEGAAGDYRVTMIKMPRYVKEDVCNGCGDCANICPVRGIPSKFDINLKTRGAIFIPFPSSVPPTYIIDETKCLLINYGICNLCARVCTTNAIDFFQKKEEIVLNVGAIVIATGYIQNMPGIYENLAGESRNVLSSMQFERLLSANGPTNGNIIRLDNYERPKSIAFLQCVGSRDFHHPECKKYCSSICCMASAKQAIIVKEHNPEIECYIFSTEIRAKGKNFYEFIERSKHEYNVIYINGKVSLIKNCSENGKLKLFYEDIDEGIVRTSKVDMAILASALFPPKSYYDLLNQLNVRYNEFGFIRDDDLYSLEKKNIFFIGYSRNPKDIPSTVAEASACAAKISERLHIVRFQNVIESKYPPEIPVNPQDDPRVGILICRCGSNIGGIVDVKRVVDYVSKLPYVVYADENMYSCSSDSQKLIKDMILKHNLNRFIVASCTPRTHENLFRNTLREVGLNPYLFELVNIRDQDSWVHQNEPEQATKKACDLIRMYLAKVINLKPLQKIKVEVEKSVLIIGGGIAGIFSAKNLANQGFEVYLIERESILGGRALDFIDLYRLPYIKNDVMNTINELKKKSTVHILLNSEIREIRGYVGNYKVIVKSHSNGVKEHKLNIGTIIVSIGTKQKRVERWHDISEKNPMHVFTQSDFIKINDENIPSFKDATIILCVDQRKNEYNNGNDSKTYCSNVCCNIALMNIEKLFRLNPRAHIHVLYRELQFSDLHAEKIGRDIRKKVLFERYSSIDNIKISKNTNRFKIRYYNVGAQTDIEFITDLLILATPAIPERGTEELAKILKVPTTKDGFLLEAHVKLRPVDFSTDGIFLCGGAHWPKWIDESIIQAYAASGRATMLMANGGIDTECVTAYMNEEKCLGCGRCAEICPYKAIELIDKTKQMGLYTIKMKKAQINSAICKGCGLCVAECSLGAIDQNFFSKLQINKMIELLIGLETKAKEFN
ncbi:MAG: FAD-dependent oxidoreductase [Candidatus Hodarchaeota archaeon]